MTIKTSSGASKGAGRIIARYSTKIMLSLIAILVSVLWIFPVYWMANSSLLPGVRLRSRKPIFWAGDYANFDNFGKIFEREDFWPSMRLSLVVTLVTVFVALLFAFLASLAVSRFRFKGRKTFVLAVLLIQMLPAEGMFLAQNRMMKGFGLLDTGQGLIILYIAAIVPFTVWMLRGFVAGVPIELEEAAMVDGLSRAQAFFRITLPLLAPGLVAAGVFGFLQAWNEYTVARVILDEQRTLPLWLTNLTTEVTNRAPDWGLVMAGATVIAIPVVIFFLIVQGRMTSGLVSGAVKG